MTSGISDLCVIMEKRPQKTHYLSGFVTISKFVACNPLKCVVPVFQGADLCVIMEKRPHKTHCLSDLMQILICVKYWKKDLVKPFASVVLCKFRLLFFLLLVLHSNCVAPVFRGGDLCVLMEKGPHKIRCLSGFVKILVSFACNPFRLCGPRFSRG